MADVKSCEEKRSIGTLTVDVDVSDALKGLKAVQREARKTTAALKEVESRTKDKYLVIELDKLGDVPNVFHNGKKIDHKIKVRFNWDTSNERYPSRTSICIDYYEENERGEPVRKKFTI